LEDNPRESISGGGGLPAGLYSRRSINFVFLLLIIVNLLGNIDHGTLPAGSITIKGELGLDNLQFGLLGSVVFLGLTFGKFI
jgi:hypothetical protein